MAAPQLPPLWPAVGRPGGGPRRVPGGFLTPAVALGAPLRERLHEVGIRFDELELDELPSGAATRAAPSAKL